MAIAEVVRLLPVDEQVELAGGERVVLERLGVVEVRRRPEPSPAEATPIAPRPASSVRRESPIVSMLSLSLP